jgi:hypothetical protein
MDRLPGLPPWKLSTTLRRSCRSRTQIICGARSRYRTGRPRPSSRSWQRGQRRFVHDSPLEGDGFELPVPREMTTIFGPRCVR